MAGANLARINPDVLAWALRRRGVTPDQIATRQLTAEQIKAWQTKGGGSPTHPQAEALASKLRIPFLLLFLSEVPELNLEIPDLRTVSEKPATPPSIDFVQVINDCMVRQDWYREIQQSNDAKPLPFVGSFRTHRDIAAVAHDIRTMLAVGPRQQKANTWNELLKELITAAEVLGVLVFRSAVVGHANNKKLSVKEFRGFVLSDAFAPIVFINGDDAKAAQSFTLIHELAHIWVGETGISDPHLKKRSADLVNYKERFCNSVAAEVLVPAAEFHSLWDAGRGLKANITSLGARFRVSSLVILIRAREL